MCVQSESKYLWTVFGEFFWIGYWLRCGLWAAAASLSNGLLQIFIVVTNGPSLDTTQTSNIARYAWSQGWKIIGVFVGASTEDGYQEIRQISTVETEAEELRADSFSDLESRVSRLVRAARISAFVTWPGPSSLFRY